MSSPEFVTTLFGRAREVLNGGAPGLPVELATRSFSWTGGGTGPAPLTADPEPGEDVA